MATDSDLGWEITETEMINIRIERLYVPSHEWNEIELSSVSAYTQDKALEHNQQHFLIYI